jgi:retinol dehydrogenase 12
MQILNDLSGKLCVVTGATSGIGLATACALARLGAEVVGVGRDAVRCEQAGETLRAAAQASGAPAPHFERADLSLMSATLDLAERLSARHGRMDALVNCAGIFTSKRALTSEGLETQFAVNHLAPFVLTRRLIPVLEASHDARVILVSSGSHFAGRINWKDPSFGRFYFGLRAYEQSKLANILFSYELARRLGRDTRLTVFAVDPGLVNTDMGQKHGLSPSSLVWNLRRKGGVAPGAAANDIAWLAGEPGLRGQTGMYWKNKQPVPSSRPSYSDQDAQRLWFLSERLVSGRAVA